MLKEIRTVKITEKGQIVIPKVIRILAGFREGSKIGLVAHNNKIELISLNQLSEEMFPALVSEEALAETWDTPEEDKIWKDL